MMQNKHLFKRIFFLLILSVLISFVSIALAKNIKKERCSVNREIVNIRLGPSLGQKILWKLERFCPLLIIEKKGRWYKIEDFEGDIGWIHNSCVNKTKTVITKEDNCIARKKPIVTSEIIFETTDKGVPFKVLDKKGEWIKLFHSSKSQAWMHKKCLW